SDEKGWKMMKSRDTNGRSMEQPLHAQGRGISRREFVKAGVGGLATLYGLGLAQRASASHSWYRPELKLELPVEPGAELRVLRWVGFVPSDEEAWERNTRKWEEMTGARVHVE